MEDLSGEIDFEEVQKVKEAISGQVSAAQRNGELAITVGNTGISLRITSGHEEQAAADFHPENFGAAYGRKFRPTLMMGYGLYTLYLFAKSNPQLMEWKKLVIDANTNELMANVLSEGLKTKGHGSFITVFRNEDNPYVGVRIKLGEILALPEEDPLIVRIGRLHKRAANMTVESTKS